MNPFFKSPLRFLAVVVMWIMITFIMTYVYHLISGYQVQDAALFLAPPFFVLFFMLLSVWYICHFTPLRKNPWYNIIIRHGVSALFIQFIWLLIFTGYIRLLDNLYPEKEWALVLQNSYSLWITTGLVFYFVSVLLNYFIIIADQARKIEEKALHSRIAAVQAELKSLKSTIHPHFLFNSFTALDALIRTDPDKARQVCLYLSDFLRYSIRYGEKDFVTVKDEVEHISNYLEVEKVRFGKRLEVEMQIDPLVLDFKIIPFVLLPLAENAVKHGVSQMIGNCKVRFRILRDGDFICIETENPYDPSSPVADISGTGLENLKRRLDTYYGDDVYLKLVRKKGTALVSISLPFIKK